MKRLTITLIILLAPITGLLAQEVYVNPEDSSFRAKYDRMEFGEQFSVHALSDHAHDYYLVDFSRLKSDFVKVYFMNLVFKGDKVVNMDGDLKHDRIWFSAVKGTGGPVVHDYFLELKKKSEQASEMFTDEEKADWMKKNNKYTWNANK